MKVIIRVRSTPFWRVTRTPKTAKVRKPRPERIQPFTDVANARRGAPPLAIWAMTMMLMIGFMSVSMFATASASASEARPAFQAFTLNEEDPVQPILGEVSNDCRVMIEQENRLHCLASVEYRLDHSGIVLIGPQPPGTAR